MSAMTSRPAILTPIWEAPAQGSWVWEELGLAVLEMRKLELASNYKRDMERNKDF